MKTANSSKTVSAAGTIAAALPSYREGARLVTPYVPRHGPLPVRGIAPVDALAIVNTVFGGAIFGLLVAMMRQSMANRADIAVLRQLIELADQKVNWIQSMVLEDLLQRLKGREHVERSPNNR